MRNGKKHTYVVLAYKESNHLEECIKSVLKQKYKSKVVIGTSTPNDFIVALAKKYKLNIIENNVSKGIGYDFDFAITCAETELVTIAHQDDIYDYEYSDAIVRLYEKNKKPLMIFPNYYEIKDGRKEFKSLNFKIKSLMLLPLKFKVLRGKKFFKRLVLRFGNPICCPAVTFVKNKVELPLFACDELASNIDWYAYEKLSKVKGEFVYTKQRLMGHRIHEYSTTTKIIGENIRTKEDLYMFKKFWPNWIARLLAKIYKQSEKSNDIYCDK